MKRDVLHALQRPQVGQDRGERMILTEVRIPIRGDHLQRDLLARAQHVLQQRQRLRISPVQVIEYYAQRHRLRHLGQQPGDGVEQQVAELVRLASNLAERSEDLPAPQSSESGYDRAELLSLIKAIP